MIAIYPPMLRARARVCVCVCVYDFVIAYALISGTIKFIPSNEKNGHSLPSYWECGKCDRRCDTDLVSFSLSLLPFCMLLCIVWWGPWWDHDVFHRIWKAICSCVRHLSRLVRQICRLPIWKNFMARRSRQVCLRVYRALLCAGLCCVYIGLFCVLPIRKNFVARRSRRVCFACIQGSFACRALLHVYRALLRIEYLEESYVKAIAAGVFYVYKGLFCVQGSVACI